MSKKSKRFVDRVKDTWRVLQQLLGERQALPRRGRRLAPLQELEDRCLLSGSPVAKPYSFGAVQGTALSVNQATGVLSLDTDPNGLTLSAYLISGPAHGALTLSTNGSFIYTGNASFTGADTFTYVANDGLASSTVATVTLNVGPVQAPTAHNDTYSAMQTGSLNVNAALGVLTNDSDPQGRALTAGLVSGPADGTLTFNSDGSFTYTPVSTFSGSDSFTYRDSNGLVDSSVATVTVNVTPVTAPTAPNYTFTLNPDTTLNLGGGQGVLSNATGPNGYSLTAVLVTGPADGVLNWNNNGGFQYTPDANFSNGVDHFTYRVSDSLGNSGTGTVTLTVGAVQAPVVQSYTYSATAGQQLNVGGGQGVLSNDTDPQGLHLSAVLASSPTNGTLNWNNNGGFQYTPNGGFVGTDTFTYRANNGLASSALATVTITVTAAPTADNDYYSTSTNTALSVTVTGHGGPHGMGSGTGGLLANDVDPEGNTLTAALVQGPGHGTLTFNSNGSFTYTPNNGFTGADQFQYKDYDAVTNTYSNTATVTITVSASPASPPVVTGITYSIAEGGTLQVNNSAGVLSVDTDPQSLTLHAQLVSGPSDGTLQFGNDGSFKYTPNLDFSGSDTFTYQAYDGQAQSSIATVTVNVTPVTTPTAYNIGYTLNPDTTLNVNNQNGVLTGDLNPLSNNLTAVLISGPTHGTLNLNNNGQFQYTPNANFTGPDYFTYQASDGATNSGTATVTLTVSPLAAPTAPPETYSLNQASNLNVDAGHGLLNGVSDPQGRAMSVVLVSGPADGTLTLNTNGSFQYTPNLSFSGDDTFTYRIDDGLASSGTATVTLAVTPLTLPVANADTYNVTQGAILNVSSANGVLNNDTGPTSYPLNPVLVSGPTDGVLTFNSDGSFTYTPNLDFAGTDSFKYRLNDTLANSNVATVTVNVGAAQAPIASGDSYNGTSNANLTVGGGGVLAGDSDPQSRALTAVLVNGPSNGLLILNANGTFTYRPNTNFAGPDSFTYVANNGLADSTSATVNLAVTSGPSNTSVVSSNHSPVYGQSVTFTATVSPVNPASATLTGTVTFFDGTTDLGTVSLTSGTAQYMTSALGAGTHDITIEYSGDTYFAAKTSAVLTQNVTPALLTVTANSATRIYGQVNPVFTIAPITGFVNGDPSSVVSGSASLTTTATAGTGVGTYTITAAQGTLHAANYTFTFVNSTLTITKATLTVTADSTSKVAGQPNPVFMDTITGFVNGDPSSAVSGSASLTTSATTGSGVGSYTITAAQGTLGANNYSFVYVNGTLTVTLSGPYLVSGTSVISSNSASGYGDSVTFTATVGPVFPATGTPTGSVTFIDGATDLAVVSLTGGSHAYTTSLLFAGSHDITVEYGGDSTFLISTSSTLTQTVSSAVLTVTANNATKVYGQANPVFTDTITGFVNGENASVVSGNLGTSATAASWVGGYPVTLGTLSAANYSFVLSGGSLTVTPALLTVTPNDLSRVYGQANPVLTESITGFVNGDNASVVSGSLSTTATAGSGVGSYSISLGSLSATNYNFALNSGDSLTVTPAVLTVAANDASKVYGQANPTLTETITGFVNGDNAGVVSGSPILSTGATTGSGAGSYAITVAPGNLSANNYSFAYANGTLTIESASSPVSTPPPASAAAVASGILGLISPHSESSSGESSAPPGSSALVVLITKVQQVTAMTPSSGNGNSAHEGGAPAPMAPIVVVASRSNDVFAVVPPSMARSTQDLTQEMAEELPLPSSLMSRIIASTTSAAKQLGQGDFFDTLSEDGERTPVLDGSFESTAMVGTGILAGSGYVLLNSRLGLWLLGLLTAQPLWKQFDPLEVLYAWEDDGRNSFKDDEDEETLMSLVD